MIEILAPKPYNGSPRPWIFLCGSIEMGAAEQWQKVIVAALKDVKGTVLNPRREDWDSSWKQSIHDPQFYEQVTWELAAQEQADLILVNFDPQTKAPITLLELGLFAPDRQVVVHCPEGYWRKGNVDIVCERWGVRQVNDFNGLISAARQRAEEEG